MHVTLAYAASVNGSITEGSSGSYGWSSPEDHAHFADLKDESDAIVFGSGTYDPKRHLPVPGKLKVVMTSQPEKFTAQKITGQIEFSSEKPRELIERLGRAGHQKVLLASGAQLSTSFIKAGLVDELVVTYEPQLFSGHPMFTEELQPVSLRLLSVERLNENGTLLVRYRVQN